MWSFLAIILNVARYNLEDSNKNWNLNLLLGV